MPYGSTTGYKRVNETREYEEGGDDGLMLVDMRRVKLNCLCTGGDAHKDCDIQIHIDPQLKLLSITHNTPIDQKFSNITTSIL